MPLPIVRFPGHVRIRPNQPYLNHRLSTHRMARVTSPGLAAGSTTPPTQHLRQSCGVRVPSAFVDRVVLQLNCGGRSPLLVLQMLPVAGYLPPTRKDHRRELVSQLGAAFVMDERLGVKHRIWFAASCVRATRRVRLGTLFAGVPCVVCHCVRVCLGGHGERTANNARSNR